jgi:hypothetical protein
MPSSGQAQANVKTGCSQNAIQSRYFGLEEAAKGNLRMMVRAWRPSTPAKGPPRACRPKQSDPYQQVRQQKSCTGKTRGKEKKEKVILSFQIYVLAPVGSGALPTSILIERFYKERRTPRT